MNKFTSFIVFAFSIVIMVVIVFTMIRRASETKEEQAERLGIVKTELVRCDLPTLDLGNQEQFNASLDERFEKGGLAAVRDFVEKEFVPGRSIVMPSNVPGEPLPSFSLIDREIRRCNTDGAVVLDAPPVLARGMATMKLGNDSLIETWSRTSINDPYQLTVWWVRHRGP